MSTTATPIWDIHADGSSEQMHGALDALLRLSPEEGERVLEAARRERRGADGRKVIDTYVARYRASLRKILEKVA